MTTVAGYIHSRLQSQIVDLIIPRIIKYMQTKNVMITTQELYQVIGINIPPVETKSYTQPNIRITPAPVPLQAIQYSTQHSIPSLHSISQLPSAPSVLQTASQPNAPSLHSTSQLNTTISAQGIEAKMWKDGLLRESKHGFILKPQNATPQYVCIGISPDANIMRPLTTAEEVIALGLKIPLATSAMGSLKINGHSVTTDGTPPGQPVSMLAKQV